VTADDGVGDGVTVDDGASAPGTPTPHPASTAAAGRATSRTRGLIAAMLTHGTMGP